MFVAEFFLTQTPAEHVAEVYPRFLSRYPPLSAIERGTVEGLVSVIEPLGFQNMRAEAPSRIATEYRTIPTDRAELVDLPRVGPYVADATLCFGVGERRVIVDRNVDRVYERVFGDAWPDSSRARRDFAKDILPRDSETARRYTFGLLDFGALTCTRQSPACGECFGRTYCRYYRALDREEWRPVDLD